MQVFILTKLYSRILKIIYKWQNHRDVIIMFDHLITIRWVQKIFKGQPSLNYISHKNELICIYLTF